MNKPLWTRDFTIITVGTIISMLGSSITWFTLGLLVFDKTDSTFLYSLVSIAWQLPNFILPLFAGAYLDRFSRKKVIYVLDFLNGFIFVIASIMIGTGYYNYLLILLLTFVVGSIGCFYNVAYESFYPTLITEGNYQRAYSIGSLIYPVTNALMMPIAGFVYTRYGATPLLIFNAVSFIFAAIIEMFIKAEEKHIQIDSASPSIQSILQNFGRDTKLGFDYVRGEKGLWAVTLFFTVNMLAGGVIQNLYVPFFSTTPGYTIEQMSTVMAFASIGRVLGGLMHYFIRYPKEKKFAIAVFVYAGITLIDAVFFHSSFQYMIVLMFVSGLMGITSYNIRISATHSYVPDDKRGRFNGIFMMFTSVGGLIGALIAGGLGEILAPQVIALLSSSAVLISIYLILIRNKEAVKKLYNRNA